MAIAIAGAEALAGISAQMSGMTMEHAYNQFMTDRFETDNGPNIGFGIFTGKTPAISGDTSGSISTGTPSVTPVDAWHDYVENEKSDVSDTTGGIVSGSSVKTIPYSVMGGTGALDLQAVMPIGVPVEAAVVAVSQAAGVSIDAVNLDVETKRTLVNSYVSTSGVIYDKVQGLVTAWKDSLGRILFPKKAFDAIYDVARQWGGDKKYSVDPSVTPDIPYGSLVLSSNSFALDSGSGYKNEYTFNTPGVVWAYTTNPLYVTPMVIADTPFTYNHKTIKVSTGEVVTDETRTVNLGSKRTLISNSQYALYRMSPLNPSVVTVTPAPTNNSISYIDEQQIATVIIDGTLTPGGYPEGASESQADKYTPSTIPVAGNLATSYDPDTGVLGTEPLVPIHLTDDPYNSTGDTENPTGPTDENNTGLKNPPIPLPIPDTKPSNPDVPLTDSSVINSTLINELVEELANTLDPQPGQSSGIIPVPPLPGITDPETGQTTFPSIIPDSGPGFIHVYNPTPAEFVAFGSWLWVTYADATIDKILNNPFDGVIGAHELYATPNRGGRDNIRSAFLVCPTTADLVPNRYSEIDCGTVIVPEFYGNYLDYSPYSQAYIYLPFIGINEVSIDDIVGHAVNIRYRVDSYSGSCIAMIFVAKDGYQNLCYQFAGSCSVEVPMAGGSQAAIKAGMMQAEAYARSAMVSAGGHLLGGIGSALMGSLGGALSSVAGIAGDYANAKAGVEAARVANKSSVQHSGQFGASHGAMGQKIPFIIIRNPIQVKVVNYNDDYGYPAHKRVIIGGCTGYLRVREVNVISAHATDDEKAAIEALLKNGVYVS